MNLDGFAGTQYERMSLVKTVVELAADRNHALAWNMASDALNNAYFLSRLVSIIILSLSCNIQQTDNIYRQTTRANDRLLKRIG